MEQVNDNVRYAVNSPNSSRSSLRGAGLNTESLRPTVGAGGQYQVSVQTPAKTSAEKLAESLAVLDDTVGKIVESNVAQSELAVQQQADMELEDVQSKALEAKEVEESIYKAGSFVDRLVRTGQRPAQGNPLFYTRARRAYGERVANEEYNKRVSTALSEARKAYRSDPEKSYVTADIMKSVADEVREEFGIDEGSAGAGFGNIAARLNNSHTVRDLEYQDKITRTHSVVQKADEIAAAIMGSHLQDNAATAELLKDVFSRHANLSAKDSGAALYAGLSKAVNSGALGANEAQAFINNIRSGEFKGLKLGGFDIASTAFDQTLERIETDIQRQEDRNERESEVNTTALKREVTDALTSALRLDYSQGGVPIEEILADVPDDLVGSTVASSEEAMNVIESAYIANNEAGKFAIRSAVHTFDVNSENRERALKVQEDSYAGGRLGYTMRGFSNEYQRVKNLQSDQMVSENVKTDISAAERQFRTDHNEVVKNGTLKGKPVMIGDVPFTEASDEQQQLYLDGLFQDFVSATYKAQAKEQVNLELAEKQAEEENLKRASSESQEDLFKANLDNVSIGRKKIQSLLPNASRSLDYEKRTWDIAKMQRGQSEYYRQLAADENRSEFVDFIRSSNDILDRQGSESGETQLRGFKGVTYEVPIYNPRLGDDEILKVKRGMVAYMTAAGLNIEDVRSMKSGRISLGEGVTISPTEEDFKRVPIKGSDADLREALQIIKKNFNSDITLVDLMKVRDLHESRLNKNQ